jgi:GTPase
VTRAAVLQPYAGIPGQRSHEAALAEAVALTAAIELEVTHSETVRMNRISPATLMGKGAVERIKAAIEASEIKLVVVNHALSPIQQRNLEQEWGCKVIDRTGLILEIFGARAHTNEGQLQVELAALDYQRSRLVRSWTHLERQRGGFGFLGGPGESQLEIDRRLIEQRIARIRKDLDKVRQTRALQRQARIANETPVIALVGYTNAGKSTLFNRITGAEVLAKDMLFATLDPTVRQLKLPSGRVCVLTDTVGFISDLPHQLVAAFRATLEEVELADIILHVRDAASAESAAQKSDVEQTLSEIGIDCAHDSRLVEVLNKIDQLPEDERPVLSKRQSESTVALSALSGQGIDQLISLIDHRLQGQRETLRVCLHPSEGEKLAWLYAHGKIANRADSEEEINLIVSLSAKDLGRYRSLYSKAAQE